MNKNKGFLLPILALMGVLLMSGVAFADTTSTTVTYVIPSYVSHSLSYSGACSSSTMYYVEMDAVKDGTQTMINSTSDAAGGTACQTGANAAFTINNGGSVNINVTANFSAALPSGVVMKAANASTGYVATCGGVVNSTNCAYINNTINTVLAQNLVAVTGTKNIWLWADFSNFNGGVATTGVQRTLQTNAVQS